MLSENETVSTRTSLLPSLSRRYKKDASDEGSIKQLDKSLISQTQPEKKSINYHNPKMKLSLATMAAVAVANDKKVN